MEFRTAHAIDCFTKCSGTRRFILHEDGEILPWDSVAGHYTVCHSLRPGQIRYLRGLARRLAAGGAL